MRKIILVVKDFDYHQYPSLHGAINDLNTRLLREGLVFNGILTEVKSLRAYVWKEVREKETPPNEKA